MHAWGDTLVVPDADAPFHLLPFVFDLDVDGYVFVSSPDGALFTERAPRVEALAHRPSSLVSAPLVVHRGSLWAASTRTGEVFEAR